MKRMGQGKQQPQNNDRLKAQTPFNFVLKKRSNLHAHCLIFKIRFTVARKPIQAANLGVQAPVPPPEQALRQISERRIVNVLGPRFCDSLQGGGDNAAAVSGARFSFFRSVRLVGGSAGG
jgi:hypothetical protein